MERAADPLPTIVCIRVRRRGRVIREVPLQRKPLAVLTSLPDGVRMVSTADPRLPYRADRAPALDLVVDERISFGPERFVVAVVTAGARFDGSRDESVVPLVGGYDPQRFPVLYGEAHATWVAAISPAAIAFLRRKSSEWTRADADLLRCALDVEAVHHVRLDAWRQLVASLGYHGQIRVRKSGRFRLDHVLPVLVARGFEFVPERPAPVPWKGFHSSLRALELPPGLGGAVRAFEDDDGL